MSCIHAIEGTVVSIALLLVAFMIGYMVGNDKL
jgi:hypothetical protein